MSDSEVKRRSNELLKRMTPSEKIGQLNQVFVFGRSRSVEARVKAGELGSVLFMTDPANINNLQKAAVEGSRLHIPLLFGFDVIHGLRTIFPVPIGMAASWNPAMVEAAQSTAAEEARSVGIDWAFSPMLDIARDARWGRMVEGAGEDPYLGSAMAVAQVRGFQGAYIGAPNHIIACAKHFAGYGAAQGGRDYDAAEISDDEFWNVYLPPFKNAVDAGVGSVMSAYMDLNGVPATGNRWLLHSVLRSQLGFKGFIVSDADAVNSLKTHGFAKDTNDAAVRAFEAGVNMEMAVFKTAYSTGLPDALTKGLITPTQLDDAVRPILEAKLRMGLFENPYVDESKAKATLDEPAHKEQALHSAEQSTVLLRNEAGLLPLKAGKYSRIAVIGPLANSKADTLGSWAFDDDPAETVSVFDGLRRKERSGVEVQFAQGVQLTRLYPSPFGQLQKGKKQVPWTDAQAAEEFSKAVKLSDQSDLTVMVLGEAQDMSGESASRSSLDLPGKQEQLLEKIVAQGKPVVLVLLNGRPLNIVWASHHVPAILEAWYPGTQGGTAVANILYGEAVPGGKLPFTWPRDVGQVPLFYAHNTTHAPENQGKRYWNEEGTPLYPFGYGLSYAKFGIANLTVSRPTVIRGQDVEVSADVENQSDIAADEVVQMYTHQQYGSSSRPVRELKGFQRVALAPHETKTVRFSLEGKDRAYWSSTTGSWLEDLATFDVWMGSDSTATLHSGFEVVSNNSRSSK